MPSKCIFCDETYGDAEQHYCIGQLGPEAEEVFKEYKEALKEECNRAVVDAIFRLKMEELCISGKSVPSKDDN